MMHGAKPPISLQHVYLMYINC